MSIRYWFGRFARSKGLRIFNYAWAIITLIIFGLMLYGHRDRMPEAPHPRTRRSRLNRWRPNPPAQGQNEISSPRRVPGDARPNGE